MKPVSIAQGAGVLYLLIIALGLTSEIAVRAPLLALDAADVATRISAMETLFRLSVAADAVMVAADIALAYLLFRLLSPAGETLAALAALFRLTQAALIAANLLNQHEALLWIDEGRAELALHALKLHGAGYDLGLIFFGINSVLTGVLLVRSPEFARWLGWLLVAVERSI